MTFSFAVPNMLGDVKSQSKERGHAVPNEYMPFSCTVLNRFLQDFAAKNLNETEESRRNGLQAVREYVKNELGVLNEVEDNQLLVFLRSRKFDVTRTCQLLKKGYDFVNSHRQIFDRKDTQMVQKVIDSEVIGFLPYRDSKGRAIIFLRTACWKPDEMKADDLIFGCIVSLHIASENPVNQVSGFVVIVDFKNLTFHHMTSISSWLIFGIQALQKCCPLLVKEFHVLNMPGVVRSAWKLIRPIINEKIRKRIIFYKCADWESLHSRIPPVILPEELGGHLGPFCNKHWADISTIQSSFTEKMDVFFNRLKKI